MVILNNGRLCHNRGKHDNLTICNFALKLFRLIFMVRFINIMEQIWPVYGGATSRLVPMREEKYAQKIDKGCHKVNNFLYCLCYVNKFRQLHYFNPNPHNLTTDFNPYICTV